MLGEVDIIGGDAQVSGDLLRRLVTQGEQLEGAEGAGVGSGLRAEDPQCLLENLPLALLVPQLGEAVATRQVDDRRDAPLLATGGPGRPMIVNAMAGIFPPDTTSPPGPACPGRRRPRRHR